MKERLDKFISNQTSLSRRDAGKAIRSKRVTVGGELCLSVDRKVDPKVDKIALDGQTVRYDEYVYYMLYKPEGVVSATEDRSETTVLDILPADFRRDGLFPAGRLDKDTTGLLILTDDGDYAHRMLSPKKHVKKTYIATLDREPDDAVTDAFAKGITLADGTVCKPGRAVPIGNLRAEVTISEGKYHQVRRMFAALGFRVTALERVRIGSLTLDSVLKKGEVKPLTPQEAALVFTDFSAGG